MKVEVTKTVPVEPPVRIVIECTHREAQYLQELCYSTDYPAEGNNTPVRFVRELGDALKRQGIERPLGGRTGIYGDVFFTGRAVGTGKF